MQPATKIIIGVLGATAAIGIVVIYRNNAAASAASAAAMVPTATATATTTTTAPASNIYSYTPAAITPLAVPLIPVNGGSGGGSGGNNISASNPSPSGSTDPNFPYADGNDYPLAAQIMIGATTSSLNNQQSLQLQWIAANTAQSNSQMQAVYNAAATNMYQQAMNQKNKRMTGAEYTPLQNAYSAITSNSGNAVTLANNLTSIYNQIYGNPVQKPVIEGSEIASAIFQGGSSNIRPIVSLTQELFGGSGIKL